MRDRELTKEQRRGGIFRNSYRLVSVRFRQLRDRGKKSMLRTSGKEEALMLQRNSHREERPAADRDQPTLARRIQQLSESGEYEGFNAIAGALLRQNEFDAIAIDVIKRDTEFKNRITEICHDRSERRLSRQ
jgi:hypothetical protein